MKKIRIFLLSVISVLLFTSCASSPPKFEEVYSISPLMQAIKDKNMTQINMLVHDQSELKKLNTLGSHALAYAIGKADAATIAKLIERGLAVNHKNYLGVTPLHAAAYLGDMEIIKLLLRAGANIHARDHLNKSPIYYAIDSRQLEVIKLLAFNGGTKKYTSSAELPSREKSFHWKEGNLTAPYNPASYVTVDHWHRMQHSPGFIMQGNTNKKWVLDHFNEKPIQTALLSYFDRRQHASKNGFGKTLYTSYLDNVHIQYDKNELYYLLERTKGKWARSSDDFFEGFQFLHDYYLAQYGRFSRIDILELLEVAAATRKMQSFHWIWEKYSHLFIDNHGRRVGGRLPNIPGIALYNRDNRLLEFWFSQVSYPSNWRCRYERYIGVEHVRDRSGPDWARKYDLAKRTETNVADHVPYHYDCYSKARLWENQYAVDLFDETGYAKYWWKDPSQKGTGELMANALLGAVKSGAEEYYGVRNSTDSLIETSRALSRENEYRTAADNSQRLQRQNQYNDDSSTATDSINYQKDQYLIQPKIEAVDCGAFADYESSTNKCKGRSVWHAQIGSNGTLSESSENSPRDQMQFAENDNVVRQSEEKHVKTPTADQSERPDENIDTAGSDIERNQVSDFYESLSYCREAKNSKWVCDGLTQNTIIPDSLDKSLRQSGCKKIRKYVSFQEGRIYFCTDRKFDPRAKSGKATWNRDISQWLEIPEVILQQRQKFDEF